MSSTESDVINQKWCHFWPEVKPELQLPDRRLKWSIWHFLLLEMQHFLGKIFSCTCHNVSTYINFDWIFFNVFFAADIPFPSHWVWRVSRGVRAVQDTLFSMYFSSYCNFCSYFNFYILSTFVGRYLFTVNIYNMNLVNIFLEKLVLRIWITHLMLRNNSGIVT